MTIIDFLILLVVAGVCGGIGKALTGIERGGILVSIALGFIGALVGLWIARALELPTVFSLEVGGASFPIVWSIIGSAIFIAILGLFTRGRGRRRD